MILEVRGLHCGYGADEIVHGIDLDVAAGSIVAILGPNGSGKSTFLKAVLGYLRLSRGSVRFSGQDIAGQGASAIAAAGVGYVPQLNNVFKPMTILENLEMGGYRLGAAARAGRIADLFDLFPLLKERRGQPAGTLSGGERQLLVIARALMGEPALLVLDEPTAGLGPPAVEAVAVALTGAVLFAEAGLALARRRADRILLLERGTIALDAPREAALADARLGDAYLVR